VADIRHKCCNPKADPVILKEGPSTAWVDGNNGLGVVVGTFRCRCYFEKFLFFKLFFNGIKAIKSHAYKLQYSKFPNFMSPQVTPAGVTCGVTEVAVLI
jgi:hypothetical protein